MKTIVIFDGDTLAYRAAAVIEARSILVTHIKTGRTAKYANRTEFKKFLATQPKQWDMSKFQIEDVYESQPAVNACAIVKNQIEKITTELFADKYLICLSGKTNFRNDLPLPVKYKGSRVDQHRPEHLAAVKNYLWKNHPKHLSVNCEADDTSVYIGYEYLNKGWNVILAAQDKDAYAYPGLNIYDYTQDEPKLETIDSFGEIHLNSYGKGEGQGLLWTCFQWLAGDDTDDYKPTTAAGIRFGDKSAYKLLKDARTPYEALSIVVNQYKKWYPEEFTYITWDGKEQKADYKFMLDLYFKCCRMKTHKDDELNAAEFLDMYGVELE